MGQPKRDGDILRAIDTTDQAVVAGDLKQLMVWTNKETGQIHSSFFLKKTKIATAKLVRRSNKDFFDWIIEDGISYAYRGVSGSLDTTVASDTADLVQLNIDAEQKPKKSFLFLLETHANSSSTIPIQTLTASTAMVEENGTGTLARRAPSTRVNFNPPTGRVESIIVFDIGMAVARLSGGARNNKPWHIIKNSIQASGNDKSLIGTTEIRFYILEMDLQNTAPDTTPRIPENPPVELLERGYLPSATAPENPEQWDGWLNTTNNELSIWDGTKWQKISGDSGGGNFDLQGIRVSTLQHYNEALAAQATSDEGLIIEFGITIVSSGTTYGVGDVAFVPPRSNAIERLFNKVSHTELAKETRSREGGDIINERKVRTAANLNSELRLHITDENASILIIEALFTTDTRTYRAGDRYYLAPAHNQEGNLVLIEQKQYIGKVDITPHNIAAKEDLDGTYQIVLSDVDADGLKEKGVNVLEIWFNQEAIHSTSWAPTSTAIIDAVIDESEETQIALTNQKVIPVLAVFRKDGNYIDQIGTYLTIGGQEEPSGADLSSIKAGTNVSIDRSKPGEITISSESGATATPTQQIALLNLVASPAGIAYRTVEELTAAVKAIDIQISNPELLKGDVWIEGWIQGQRGLNRTKWTSATSALRIAFDDTTAAAIATGVFDDTDIQCNIRFFDAASGGDEIERRDIFIPITKVGASDTQIGGFLNIGSPTGWTEYEITEAIEAGQHYQFLLRIGSTKNLVITAPFRGDDYLFLATTNPSASFPTQSAIIAQTEMLGIPAPRTNADGARVFFVARPADNEKMLVRINDTHNIHRLIKLA